MIYKLIVKKSRKYQIKIFKNLKNRKIRKISKISKIRKNC